MQMMNAITAVFGLGIGGTLVMDAWLVMLRWRGVPVMDFALLGRWAGHCASGTFVHDAINEATPIRGERALGWALHYGVGIAFAGLLLTFAGRHWLAEPTPGPALLVGVLTVVAPLIIVQPAMGAGLAGRRRGVPTANVLRSLANHAVFGVGLYLSARVLRELGLHG
ncbi:DUF2938 family protein [Pseudomonas sp. Marseille-QA0892]